MALRILREIPGVSVTARQQKRSDRGVDAILRFAGTHAHVAIEIKQRANAATASQLAHYAKALRGTHLLLIAGETTAEAREILKKSGIAVMDGLGNAHIELPGLLFHLEGGRGSRRPKADSLRTRLKGKAGIAAQALLLHPKREWQVQDLAKEARISASLAHRVLARLEGEGILAVEATGPNRVRRVTNPTALLDLLYEEIEEQPTRTLGYLLAQTPQQLIKKLGTNLEQSGIEYALTGAAAASLIAPFVTAIPVVDVWVPVRAAPDELHKGAHADPVPDGPNVIFLQAKNDVPLAFRVKAKELWVANRFRIYTDLRRDPRRGQEQADHLRREVIGF